MAKKKKEKKDGVVINTYKVTIYPEYSINGKEQVKNIDTIEELVDFLDISGYDPSEKEIVELIENGGEYKGLNSNEFKIELIPVEEEKEEEEKTPFNDAELFIKEYEGYLIGKKIDFSDNENKAGTRTKIISLNIGDDNSVEINTDVVGTLSLSSSGFKPFIDGEEFGNLEKDSFQLVLQEEIKYNKPEYKYYVISGDTDKILSGHEYKEDADKEKQRREKYGEETKVRTKKELSNIDLDDNNLWSVNEHDWDIVSMAINQGVEDGDYSQKRADDYISEFKNNGAYAGFVKARLLYLLSKFQKSTWRAFLNSNIDNATEQCDTTCRIQKELKRVIAMEK